jgi:hypothetical protein
VQALQRRGPISEGKAERQVVALLFTPLDKYDAVTGEPLTRGGLLSGVCVCVWV